MWKQGLQDEHSVLLHFTCAQVVMWFYEIIHFNAWWSLSLSVDFRPLFLFAGIVFPWFVYADITSETVALGTLNYVTFLSEMLKLNAHQRSVLFQNRISLSFSDSFTRTVTQHNHWCTDTSTTECKQTEETSFIVVNTSKLYSSIS
jgi:hypothetical protein